MKSAKPPITFSFDLSRADRVLWSYAGKNGEFRNSGEPAGFFVDDTKIADQFSNLLDYLTADLVDIALATHMTDRLALRSLDSQSNWSRSLEVTICVRRPEVWGDAGLKQRLERLLQFLTEDTWSLDFVKRQDPPRCSELQTHLFTREQRDQIEVSLFSGGLDSFAGTAAQLVQSDTYPVLVSATPNPQQRFRQQQQVKILRDAFGKQISHICVPYGMHRGEEYAQESSRRTRGFLFMILGGVTALFAGCSELYVYENGLGAINLPFDLSQIGTDNARGVHPRALREIGELLSLVASKRFTIRNRSIYETKAEMLQHAGLDAVKRGIPLTFSCDGFPVRARGHSQCGFCTSCILRRYSLELAGLSGQDSEGYLQDWKGGSFRPTRHHLRGLRSMDWQVLRIGRCLAAPDSWRALCLEFPELRSVVNHLCATEQQSPEAVEHSLLRLLEQHAADWVNFSALKLLNASERNAA